MVALNCATYKSIKKTNKKTWSKILWWLQNNVKVRKCRQPIQLDQLSTKYKPVFKLLHSTHSCIWLFIQIFFKKMLISMFFHTRDILHLIWHLITISPVILFLYLCPQTCNISSCCSQAVWHAARQFCGSESQKRKLCFLRKSPGDKDETQI